MLSECKLSVNLAAFTKSRMLNHRKHCRSSAALPGLVACCLLLLGSTWARAQDAVQVGDGNVAGFLNTTEAAEGEWAARTGEAASQNFDFKNQLICFKAVVGGQVGNYILDTGAPRMLVNNYGRSRQLPSSSGEGLAAGGSVNLSDEYVASFQLRGQEFRKVWALGLDLRPLEERLNDSIAGFMGYDLLRNGEVRIDYEQNRFALLRSKRHPQHDGRPPTHTLPFKMVGHLPVVTFGRGKDKLRLALDTGASINIIDGASETNVTPTEALVDVQGLDGRPILLSQVRLLESGEKSLLAAEEFVAMNLAGLQSATYDQPIDGLLGSAFLAKFVVGIDYRRNRLYLWSPPSTTNI